MLIDIHKEVNEQYLGVYNTGEGEFHILPKVNTNRRKNLTVERAVKIIESILIKHRKYPSLLWPKAVKLHIFHTNSETSQLYYHSDSINVALRVDGKWITNRGVLTDKFCVMGKPKASKLIRQYDDVECAVIKWNTISIPSYYFIAETVSRFNQRELLQETLTVRKSVLSKLVCDMAGVRWGGGVFVK